MWRNVNVDRLFRELKTVFHQHYYRRCFAGNSVDPVAQDTDVRSRFGH